MSNQESSETYRNYRKDGVPAKASNTPNTSEPKTVEPCPPGTSYADHYRPPKEQGESSDDKQTGDNAADETNKGKEQKEKGTVTVTGYIGGGAPEGGKYFKAKLVEKKKEGGEGK